MRGCPLDCEFCARVEALRAEVQLQAGRKGDRRDPPHQGAVGDSRSSSSPTTTRSPIGAWAREFLHALKRSRSALVHRDRHLDRGRRRSCWAHAPRAAAPDPDRLRVARPDSLDGIDRANWKLKRLDRYRDAIKQIQSYGITVNGCFIVGNDGDDPGVFRGFPRLHRATASCSKRRSRF